MQSCIIDSCSFLHVFQIEVGASTLSDLLEGHFNVLVHRAVNGELHGALRKAYPKWQASGLVNEEFSLIRRRHASWASLKIRHDDVNVALASLANDIGGLDLGERVCVAFAKQTADAESAYALFLTDDYSAAKIAEAIFHKYQCGFVLRTADIITFFGCRYQLAKTEIHQALRDLLAFFNSTYENLMNAVRAEGAGAAFVYDLIWRSEFKQANGVLARLPISAERRIVLERLIREVAELADTDGIIGYTLARLRLLAHTNL